jgi:hypothetical protein
MSNSRMRILVSILLFFLNAYLSLASQYPDDDLNPSIGLPDA